MSLQNSTSYACQTVVQTLVSLWLTVWCVSFCSFSRYLASFTSARMGLNCVSHRKESPGEKPSIRLPWCYPDNPVDMVKYKDTINAPCRRELVCVHIMNQCKIVCVLTWQFAVSSTSVMLASVADPRTCP